MWILRVSSRITKTKLRQSYIFETLPLTPFRPVRSPLIGYWSAIGTDRVLLPSSTETRDRAPYCTDAAQTQTRDRAPYCTEAAPMWRGRRKLFLVSSEVVIAARRTLLGGCRREGYLWRR